MKEEKIVVCGPDDPELKGAIFPPQDFDVFWASLKSLSDKSYR